MDIVPKYLEIYLNEQYNHEHKFSFIEHKGWLLQINIMSKKLRTNTNLYYDLEDNILFDYRYVEDTAYTRKFLIYSLNL